jgi:hypothetical protein
LLDGCDLQAAMAGDMTLLVSKDIRKEFEHKVEMIGASEIMINFKHRQSSRQLYLLTNSI